jgi:outer membrane receptor protein involved in Fe transport
MFMKWFHATVLGLTGTALASTLAAQERRADTARAAPAVLRIAAKPMSDALADFAQQTGLQIIVSSAAASGQRAPAVSGTYTPDAALQKILGASGLRYEFINDRTVAIRPPEAHPSGERFLEMSNVEGAQKPSFWDRFRVAQADSGTAAGGTSVAGEPAGATDTASRSALAVEEIVVTAQKRIERLQDVPVPVTALSADTLLSTNQLRLQDYYTKVPGLSLTLMGDGDAPALAIRGITTGGFTNPTVGIVIDDVAYGSSVSQGSPPIVPDIDPSELARVEVLRGPQGTLYGASSIGGLVKFVTVDPSMDSFAGRVEAGLSNIQHGDGLGYNARGSVNVPLTDTFAVRAGAFAGRDAGYVDNVRTGERGINQRDVRSGRLSALWRPADGVSLKLSALLQNSERDGTDEVHLLPGLGDLQQDALPGTGTYEREAQAYSATLSADLGAANLISSTGYSVDSVNTRLDTSPSFSGIAASAFGVAAAMNPYDGETTKFSQEVRLTMPLGQRLQWLAGVFYTKEDFAQSVSIVAADPLTGAARGTLLTIDVPNDFKEYAAFTNLTVDVTERLDIQFGGRFSRNDQSFSTTRSGLLAAPFFGSNPSIVAESRAKDSPFTYLVTPRFKMTPDLMLYARLASGYRPGGPNASCSSLSSFPCRYEADTTQNYEIGIKGDAFDHAVSFDASLYYIDWQDVQLAATDTTSFNPYIGSGGRAKSQGAELSIESRPMSGLTVSGWIAYNDAELTDDPPVGSFIARAGDKLPYSSRLSGNLSVDGEFPLVGTLTGFAGASISYVDEREGAFPGFFTLSPMREIFPSYSQIDLHAGATFATWRVNLFINNVADKRGVLTGGLDKGALHNFAYNYIQPRTAGVSLMKTF